MKTATPNAVTEAIPHTLHGSEPVSKDVAASINQSAINCGVLIFRPRSFAPLGGYRIFVNMSQSAASAARLNSAFSRSA